MRHADGAEPKERAFSRSGGRKTAILAKHMSRSGGAGPPRGHKGPETTESMKRGRVKAAVKDADVIDAVVLGQRPALFVPSQHLFQSQSWCEML